MEGVAANYPMSAKLRAASEAATFAAAVLLVTGAAAADGGYFAISWSWITLLVLAVLVVTFVVTDRRPTAIVCTA